MSRRLNPESFALTIMLLLSLYLGAAERIPVEEPTSNDELHAAAERALPLLETASAGSAEQRKCFTCHSQALPVFAIVESHRRGLTVDDQNLRRQLRHTHEHLSRGRKGYEEGRGQGGGVDTAGYALWTLEEGNWPQDDVTAAVVKWLLLEQNDKGYWSHSSNRPPSEASDFTTTYLALRALQAYGRPEDDDAIEEATSCAARWLDGAEAVDTEDQVFRLLSLEYVDLPAEITAAAVERLKLEQREDGGWAQKSDLESDAYATGTVLFALRQVGAIDSQSSAWQRAIRFLLEQQLEDGSWLVESRSKPFQTYFETGFPHGKHQFISTTATGWATLAMLDSLPLEEGPMPVPAISTPSPK